MNLKDALIYKGIFGGGCGSEGGSLRNLYIEDISSIKDTLPEWNGMRKVSDEILTASQISGSVIVVLNQLHMAIACIWIRQELIAEDEGVLFAASGEAPILAVIPEQIEAEYGIEAGLYVSEMYMEGYGFLYAYGS